jgi:hypothetical protein
MMDDLEGIGRDLIEVLSHYLLGDTEGNGESPQSKQPVYL